MKTAPHDVSRAITVFMAVSLCSGCISDGRIDQGQLKLKDPRSADPFDVVDCLLPGQIRQLGTQVTYVTERRPVRTTAEDCAIRGGEYVALDRADYGTALKIWMSAAESGDPDAQYYVAVLYEKGAEGQPNYAKAAGWYRQAADRGVRRAAINLGRLYEQGLGVEKSESEARKWFAKANDVADLGGDAAVGLFGTGEVAQQELADVRARLTERMSLLQDERRELERLKHQLGSPAQGKALNDEIVKQERVVLARQEEVATLQAKAASLKEAAQRELAGARKTPTQDKGLPGPSIQIIDPLVVMTRGIRVEEGRIAVMIPRGRPHRLTGRILAEGGIRSLEVNGAQIQFDEQGTFIVRLDSLKGAMKGVPVDIVAVDQQGKQGSKKLIVSSGETALPIDGAIPTTNRVGGYHALVIGNDHYRQWTPLGTAVADAEAMSKVLADRYGFRITVLKDADRKQILKTLNDYRKTLSDQDHLLVYYAGHGFLEPEIDRGYWIPVEGDLFDNTDWIEFPAVTDLLELIPARQILVIADSCFSGKLTRSAMGRVNPDADEQARESLLKTMAQKKIRATLTSGGAKPVLDEGGAGHSIFATAMLGVLTENNDALETERLYWTVRARVVQAAERMKFEQIPTYGPIHMAGHEGLGDFVFVPVAAPARTP
ncbi:MAG: caspase family protein [Nitrospira sp.]|nr:caspase family protein [Nitrospira sp.]